MDAPDLPSLKHHVARHLNLTSETLSQTLRRLTEAGLIRPIGSLCLQLHDLAARADAAEGVARFDDRQ